MTKLAEMKEALEAATPWPWHFVSYSVGSHDVVYAANDDFVCSTAQAEDAHLIANAPEWLAKLIAVAEAAKKLVDLYHSHQECPESVEQEEAQQAGNDLVQALEAFK